MLGTVPDPWDIYMKKTNKKACPYAVYIIEKLMGGGNVIEQRTQ